MMDWIVLTPLWSGITGYTPFFLIAFALYLLVPYFAVVVPGTIYVRTRAQEVGTDASMVQLATGVLLGLAWPVFMLSMVQGSSTGLVDFSRGLWVFLLVLAGVGLAFVFITRKALDAWTGTGRDAHRYWYASSGAQMMWGAVLMVAPIGVIATVQRPLGEEYARILFDWALILGVPVLIAAATVHAAERIADRSTLERPWRIGIMSTVVLVGFMLLVLAGILWIQTNP